MARYNYTIIGFMSTKRLHALLLYRLKEKEVELVFKIMTAIFFVALIILLLTEEFDVNALRGYLVTFGYFLFAFCLYVSVERMYDHLHIEHPIYLGLLSGAFFILVGALVL
jgi:hypothetical protein